VFNLKPFQLFLLKIFPFSSYTFTRYPGWNIFEKFGRDLASQPFATLFLTILGQVGYCRCLEAYLFKKYNEEPLNYSMPGWVVVTFMNIKIMSKQQVVQRTLQNSSNLLY
jgi:hypothetical protein